MLGNRSYVRNETGPQTLSKLEARKLPVTTCHSSVHCSNRRSHSSLLPAYPLRLAQCKSSIDWENTMSQHTIVIVYWLKNLKSTVMFGKNRCSARTSSIYSHNHSMYASAISRHTPGDLTDNQMKLLQTKEQYITKSQVPMLMLSYCWGLKSNKIPCSSF